MASSLTTKKSKEVKSEVLKQAQTAVIADILSLAINHWAKVQLDKISNNPKGLICAKTGKNSYRIGKFNMSSQTNKHTVTDIDETVVHIFGNKTAAVFYCIFETKQRYQQAKELLALDSELTKATDDKALYEHKLKLAKSQNDGWKIDLCLARLSEINIRYEYAQTNLQKTIISAKYSKVWETKS